jgi:hypothetical protein
VEESALAAYGDHAEVGVAIAEDNNDNHY